MINKKSWDINLDWIKYTSYSQLDIKKEVNPIDGKYLVEEKTIVEEAKLPFYRDNIKLVRLIDDKWKKGLEIYYLVLDGDNLFRLNGTSPPIHEVNAKAPINLDQENAMDYLKFFCHFVRGEEGPFIITDFLQPNEIPEIKDFKEKEEFNLNLYPTKFNGMDKGNFMFTSIIWYSNALFAARFKIQPSGMVHMLEDEPIQGGLSVKYPYSLS
ncbi:MAG: hypothetical protein AB3N14_21480 [Flavobacteriaceae bacterium]